MKLLLITNDDGSNGGNPPDPGSNFTVNFNSVVELPSDCQVCILAYTLKDINAKKMHYLEISNLPINTKVANIHKGQVRQIIGPLVSNNKFTYAYNHSDNQNAESVYDNQASPADQTGQHTDGQFLVNHPIWVDLENPSPIQLTSLQCKITNQNGVGSSGLSTTDPTEIMLGYRKKRV